MRTETPPRRSLRAALAATSILALSSACDAPKKDAAPAPDQEDLTGVENLGPAKPGTPSPHGGGHGRVSRSAIVPLAVNAPILTVDGTVFTKGDLERAILQHAVKAGFPSGAVDAQTRDALEEPAYEKLIERHLLAAEAKRRGLWPSDEDVAARRTELEKTLPPGKTVDDVLRETSSDLAGFTADLRTDIALERLLEAVRREVPAPDDAAVRKIYDENPDAWHIPETASAIQILVRLKKDASEDDVKAARERAEALRASLRGKTKDEVMKVAREKSEDPTAARTSGDLGTFTRGDLLPALEEVAFRLKPGQLSSPIQTARGFHLLYGTGTTKAKTIAFRDVKTQIATREHTRRHLEAFDALLDQLRAKASIARTVAPLPSPLSDRREDKKGSRVPAWRPTKENATPGLKNPHVDVPKDGKAG